MRLSVRVHPAGAALVAAAFLFLESHLVLAALLALACHEAAHVGAMAACGVKRCDIELTPFGGMADTKGYERLHPGKQAAIALSGVAASALGAWACLRFAPYTPFWKAMYQFQASLALLNCLPVWPLDGARVAMAFAALIGLESAFRKGMLLLSYILSAALVALGLYGAWLGYLNPSLMCMGPYLAYAAHESAVSQTVRRMQQLQSDKLAGNRLLPVRAFACHAIPKGAALARILRELPANGYHVLLEVEPQKGEIKSVVTEQHLAQRLFSQEEAKPGIPCGKKIDKAKEI